jgi:hypothetical protein
MHADQKRLGRESTRMDANLERGEEEAMKW